MREAGATSTLRNVTRLSVVQRCCAAPPGVVMIARQTLVRNGSSTQSEGRAEVMGLERGQRQYKGRSPLFVAAPLIYRYFPQGIPGFTMEAFLVAALLLVPVGMVGFHALQSRSYGRLGRAGYWMALAGPLAVALGAASYLFFGNVFGTSLLWLAWPLGRLLLLAGFVLYGVATLQARVLPRWCGRVKRSSQNSYPTHLGE
jgi:hypothetical protein